VLRQADSLFGHSTHPVAVQGRTTAEELRQLIISHGPPIQMDALASQLDLLIQRFTDVQSEMLGKRMAFAVIEATDEWQDALDLIESYPINEEQKDQFVSSLIRGQSYGYSE
jgi:uncharacterized coiled-coil protein SlyX